MSERELLEKLCGLRTKLDELRQFLSEGGFGLAVDWHSTINELESEVQRKIGRLVYFQNSELRIIGESYIRSPEGLLEGKQ